MNSVDLIKVKDCFMNTTKIVFILTQPYLQGKLSLTSGQLFALFRHLDFHLPLMEIPLLLIRGRLDEEEEDEKNEQSHVHGINDGIGQ